HIHRRTPDALGWVEYTQWESSQDGRRGHVDIDRVEFLGRRQDLVMRKVPIWGMASGAATRPLLGFVVLAVREGGLPAMREDMTGMQIIAAGVICALCLPVVMLAAQRWTSPLRALLQATRDVANGKQIDPIRVRSRDELAELAESFYE